MQLRSDSHEPEHFVSLVAPRFGEPQLTICSGIAADHDDPPLTASMSSLEEDDVGYQGDSGHSLLLTVACVVAVVALHLLGLWWLEQRPKQTLPPLDRGKPYRVSIVDARSLEPRVEPSSVQQAVSKATPTASTQEHEQHRSAPSQTRAATSRQPTAQRASRQSSQRSASSRSGARSQHSAQPQRHAGKTPSAQDLINQVASTASSNGWEQAADRFAAGPATGAQRNAVSRYIAYFTRSVQTYIDLNLGSEASGDALMQLGITVGRDGRLRSVRVIQSTGRADLDRLAVRTIHRAGPFRPFDSGMGSMPELSFSRTWVFGEGSGFRFR
ncbi:hypothetical protein R84981_002994 [Carnimonas sp. R-84981]|uniref:TonB family protein n=1 Tax=Carnimonas bestiolae TaxID=3402172 RepID=UPI003EDC1A4F